MGLLGAIRIWKVGALLAVGALAVITGFMLHGTPSHITYAYGVEADTSSMHPVDYAILGLRLVGGLVLILGVLAAIAYARGEMNLPDEAPPHSRVHDDRFQELGGGSDRQRDGYIPPF